MSEPDYSNYSLAELYQLRDSGDSEQSPRTAAMIEHWIKVRQAAQPTDYPAEQDAEFSFESQPPAAFNLKNFYFSASGRIGRGQYWLGSIPLAIIMTSAEFFLLEANTWLYLLIALPLIYAGFSLSIKRAHDRNKTGWFTLLFLVPIVSLWPAIELCFFKGSSGNNKFGCDPLTRC